MKYLLQKHTNYLAFKLFALLALLKNLGIMGLYDNSDWEGALDAQPPVILVVIFIMLFKNKDGSVILFLLSCITVFQRSSVKYYLLSS